MPIKRGTGGNDTLYGGGPDTLIGGQGEDTYIVYTNDDRVVEEEVGGGGLADTVYTFGSYDLGARNSVNTLSAAVHASTDPLVLIGNELTQTIIGNYGNNTIRSNGGRDILIGLAGDDIYVSKGGGDNIIEQTGHGNDIVYADGNATIVLAAGSAVETISALEHVSTYEQSLIGNELNQLIIGNMGTNTLIGFGGDDTLIGLGGADTYRVMNGREVVIEAGGGGTDTILTDVSYALVAGNAIELLVSFNEGSADPLNLMGNEFNQRISGTFGNNILNGGGGGADTLVGLTGDDIYRVYSVNDVVIEYGESGNDSIYTSASYTLGAGNSIETLSTAEHGATTAINLAGNNLANRLIGNYGDNVLDGGAGNDTLTGLVGADSFRFSSPLGAGVDTITDFGNGADVIVLDSAIFAGLAGGTLAPGAIAYGAAAADADDRIVYNAANGALLFDADGNGAGAAVQFAQLSAGIAQSAIQVRVESGYTATVTGAQGAEGNAGTTPLAFTVTLDRAASTDILLNFTTLTTGTAASDDFAAATGTVSIAAGQRTGTFNVAMNGDAFYEFAETVQVQVSGAQLQTPATGTGTILNDDGTLYLNIGGTVLIGSATGPGTPLESTYPGVTTVYFAQRSFSEPYNGAQTLVFGPNSGSASQPEVRVNPNEPYLAGALDFSQLGIGVRMVSGSDVVTADGHLLARYAPATASGVPWTTVTGTSFDDHIDRRGDSNYAGIVVGSLVTVNGGAGNDTILGAGVAHGGAGNDRLVAGLGSRLYGDAGADIFVLPTFVRTPFTNPRITPNFVMDFDPTIDRIELVLNRIPTDLAPGALAPSAFSEGATPASSSTRIYYDPATGNLSYNDPVNGPFGTPALFATLPTGLHLTADNFTLVAV
ncbi:beta strand repeat-containing protein [Sphingomonas sp. M1-B02]|uniref:beta strand repeat-containing protein n=1 Tax=Sphingomonas sp. M1-B02 TaxID=3114300 RepID=UPI00223FD7A8|nr:calcium-binding protein [Sphingomonas sp. S6-11]UZK65671.1 calcium-binding protein [Sphingomonas sp. S6-11]